ncbi:MAG TPA: hypothetical protein VFV94_12545 [Polyangiaceae bacterium]|nr:hypothetical protein [Polyangiaceae bacterium]
MAFGVALGGMALVVSQAGSAVMGGAVGVRVGSPGAGIELLRALVPIVFALLFAILAIRFGVRALRKNATLGAELARGGTLLNLTAWTGFAWLVIELVYRQLFLGWATLFGNVGRSLVCETVALALLLAVERAIPWSRAPRGLQHYGLTVVAGVALLTALSSWSHRDLVPFATLVPAALVGLAFLAFGVRRVESGPPSRMLVELGLSSSLLAGLLGRLFL